jgi:hypothetical protein
MATWPLRAVDIATVRTITAIGIAIGARPTNRHRRTRV